MASSAGSRVLVAVVRVVVGLLWIENLSWKRPPEFEVLRQFTQNAVNHEVFGPWAWLVRHLILPNFAFFGWVTFVVEACLGAFLLVGLVTRFWALVGLVQTTAIALSVMNAPNEWFWAYFLMFTAHLAVLATAAGRAYGVDGVLRPVWRARGGRLARLSVAAS